jgi:CRISPR-associated protein Csm2
MERRDQRRGQQPVRASEMKARVEEMLRGSSWSRLDKQKLVDVAKSCGFDLSKRVGGNSDVGTTQIRDIYDEFVRIRLNMERLSSKDDEIRDALQLIKPRMAYAAGRKRELRPFTEALESAIDSACCVKEGERFEEGVRALLQFVEATVQYMTYYQSFRGERG